MVTKNVGNSYNNLACTVDTAEILTPERVFPGQQIKKTYLWNLHETNACCHGNENFGILTLDSYNSACETVTTQIQERNKNLQCGQIYMHVQAKFVTDQPHCHSNKMAAYLSLKMALNALYDRYDPESFTGAGVIRITNLTMPVKFVLHIHVSTVNITVICHNVGYNTACKKMHNILPADRR